MPPASPVMASGLEEATVAALLPASGCFLWRVIVGRLRGPSGGISPYTCQYDVATATVSAPSGSAGSVVMGDARGKYGGVLYTSACWALH